MPQISIIVPVYNVEPYLRKCIDSIITQTFTDFECILIDDGSPDNCPAICDEYAAKDNRLFVIHQKNAGVSAARNAGLDIAQGELTGFVDSDDWLEPFALEKLYNKQKETNADIVVGSFYSHYSDITVSYVFDNNIITDKKEMLSDLFIKRLRTVWGKLYRTSLFDNVNYPSYLIFGEDAIVNTQIYCSFTCKIIVTISDIIYNYNCSSGGISKGLVCSKEKTINCYQSFVFIYKYLKQKRLLYGNIYKYFFLVVCSNVYKRLFYNVPKREVIKLIKKEKFPYWYFSGNKKVIFYNFINCIFIINQNLCKDIIRKFPYLRKIFFKLYKR